MQRQPLNAYSPPSALAQFVKSASGALALACGVLLAFLVFRNLGLYSTVSGDEYLYSRHARLLPLRDSPVPGYLYLGIYRATRLCGEGYYGCAKFLNAFFFVAAAAFVYLSARRVASERVSLFVALLAIVGPISSYTAYFMPESLYFLVFWVVVWLVSGLTADSRLRGWALAGAVVGLLALVKPHALLLVPGLVLHVLYVHFRPQRRIRKGVAAAATLVACALGVKFAVSFLLAGQQGLVLFGSTYGSISGRCTISEAVSCIPRMAPVFLQSLEGNLLATVLMFGLPLALASAVALRRLPAADVPQEPKLGDHQRIAFLCLSLVLTLICATALFTSLMAEADRIHQRYYDFVFPLFYLVCAGCLWNREVMANRAMRYATALLVCAVIAFVAYTNFLPYAPNHVDAPELAGLHLDRRAFLAGCALFALAAVVWCLQRAAGVRLYLFVALPIFVLLAADGVHSVLRARLAPDAFDRAGQVVKQYLSERQIEKLVVVGSQLGDVWRVLYQINARDVSYFLIPPGSKLDRSQVPADRDWILLLEDHEVKGGARIHIGTSDYRLLPRSDVVDIQFRDANLSGAVEVAQGLWAPETEGTWTSGDTVRLVFVQPLPEKFVMTLVAFPFGPNLGREFKVQVGGTESSFLLPTTSRAKVEIPISNPTKSRELSIRVPAPTSPQQLGMSADDRKLGMYLISLRVTPS